MSTADIYISIAVMVLANLLTRIFPFFFAKRELPKSIIFVEKNFPPIIMTILIFYTLGKVNLHTAPYGTRELTAVITTAWLHWKFGNYLVSIFAGTVVYMILVHVS